MKNYLVAVALFLTLGTYFLQAQTAPQAETAISTKTFAPRTGYYLIERAEDFVVGGKYVIGSAPLSTTEAVLSQNNQKAEHELGNKSAHFTNSDEIDDISPSAIWHYIMLGGNKYLLQNERSRHFMVLRDETRNVYTTTENRTDYVNVGPTTYFPNSSFCEDRIILSLKFYQKKRGRGSSYSLGWKYNTHNFLRFTDPLTGREAMRNLYSGSPQIFRFYKEGEALPPTYEATKRINFDKAGFRTFYSVHAYALPEGVTAYYAQREENIVHLYPIKHAIPARTPVILHKGEAGEVDLQLTFEDIPRLKERNDLSGTGHHITKSEIESCLFHYYALTYAQEGEGYWCFRLSQRDIPQGKAVIAFEKSKAGKNNSARALKFVVHENTVTAVKSSPTSQEANRTADALTQIFDLQGRPLPHPRHGQLYIEHGKVKMGR